MVERKKTELYAAWQASGQSKAAFCRANGLPYWKLAQAAVKTGVEQRFLEIKSAAAPVNGMDLVFKWGSVDLRLQWNFDR